MNLIDHALLGRRRPLRPPAGETLKRRSHRVGPQGTTVPHIAEPEHPFQISETGFFSFQSFAEISFFIRLVASKIRIYWHAALCAKISCERTNRTCRS